MHRWRQREGVNDPRLRNMGMQNNSVDFRERDKRVVNLVSRQMQSVRQLGVARASAGLNDALYQFMMDRR